MSYSRLDACATFAEEVEAVVLANGPALGATDADPFEDMF